MPVIFFHAGLGPFSGGYVGVDVFFVISGYLITSILLADLEAETFSLVKFYERRARRILPALYMVMAVSVGLAWVCLLPGDMKEFSKSLAAVSLFVSNIFFLFESGYFDTAAELKPLLHTWSLAVEEQYYLFFPLLLRWGWRWGTRRLVGVIGLGACASLALAHWGAFHRPDATFYLLTSRAWELAIGALAAFYLAQDRPDHVQPGVREALAWTGLALIGLTVFTYDQGTPFPSLYALAPTLGTALIILFATPATRVGRWLGSPIPVGIGLISYSAYLWHQPLLAFARQRSVTELDGLSTGALILATFILAALSWRFVEQPFRQPATIRAGAVFKAGLAGALIFIALGGAGQYHEGFRERIPPNLEWWSLKEKLKVQGDVCTRIPFADIEGVSACEFGDLAASQIVYLYGDSHAQALSSALHQRLIKERRKGIRIAIRGCSIVPEIVEARQAPVDTADCLQKWTHFLDLVAAQSAKLIIISRWTYRLYPVPGEIDALAFKNRAGGAEIETYREYLAKIGAEPARASAASKRRALEHFLAPVVRSGIDTRLIYPVPEIGWDIGKLNYRYYQREGRVLDQIAIDHDEFIQRHRFIHAVFADFDGQGQVLGVRPEALFCNTYVPGRCVAQVNSFPFYYDDDHLSDLGAQMVVDRIFQPVALRAF